MQLSCLQPNLERALSLVAPAVSGSNNLPVTQHVCLDAQGGVLNLLSNNLETSITTKCAAMIERDGGITVPHKTLFDRVRALPDSHRIDIETEQNNDQATVLKLSAGRAVTHINGAAMEDFPNPAPIQAAETITMDAADLARAITLVAPSAAKDASRPVLQGIEVRFAPEQVTMASADGFRLSIFRRDVTLSIEQALSAIVPAATMRTLARIVRGLSQPVSIAIAQNRASIEFQTEVAVIKSQLVSGTYPNWDQLVPENCSTTARIAAKDFQQVCRSADIFTSKASTNMVRFQLKNADGEEQPANEIIASATSPDIGNHTEAIPAEIDGPDNRIAFDTRFINELAAIIPPGDICIMVQNPTSPAMFTIAGSDDFTHVLMPMYVDW